MGIDVSGTKVVSINDRHERGVDTSIDANPSYGRLKGLPLVHVFRRNRMGNRRDDGNPLIHALKKRNGFSITPFWERTLMDRARSIIAKTEQLAGFDYCLPIPSSSPFCGRFADLLSEQIGASVLAPDFVRKRSVGEMLEKAKTDPPPMRPGQKSAFASQLNTWEQMDFASEYQAKLIDVKIRDLFSAFDIGGDPPDIAGKRVLIVDDLFATGSSILSVRNIVSDRLGAEAAAACFLSGA